MSETAAMVELLRPSNEVEARELQSLLAAEGIECRLAPFEVTVYPTAGLGTGPWGRLLVPSSQLEQAQALVAAYAKSEPEAIEERWHQAPVGPVAPAPSPPPPASSAPRLWTLLALVVSLVLNLLLWMRLHGMQSREDAAGRPMWETIYGSNLWYPQELRAFDDDGNHIASWFDHDDDGRSEYGVEYREDRELMRFHDADENATYEKTIIYRSGVAVFEMRDDDQDGLSETAGVPRGDGLGLPSFRDEDDDGRYDLIECQGDEGRVRFDVRACAPRR